MNVIFTCGGTAGHVNPALALAGYMQERHPDLRVLFVGTPCGMERGLIEKAGYDFRSIEVSSFQRSLSPSGIAHNVKSLKNLALAGSRARTILRDFRPDLVVGTGGYASYPLVKYAAKEGIPTAVHVSFWGSLGARFMNEHMLDFFRLEARDGMPFHHIHAAGKGSWDTMRQTLEAEQLTKTPGLDVREYIYDMADVMRAADLVICRAGASTVSELTALAVPAVIVPSPYVTNNHQEKNARILEKHGGARVILEKDATGEALYRAAGEILRSPELRRSMSAGMAELGIPDATERIYRTVMALRK